MSTQLAADRPRLLQQLWNLLVAPLVPAILLLALALPLPQAALAGPVDWHEVTATAEGRQWWDAGSLRLSRDGNLSVLSRFQPAADEAEGQRPPAARACSATPRSTAFPSGAATGSRWAPMA
jgi:hypothetical protein